MTRFLDEDNLFVQGPYEHEDLAEVLEADSDYIDYLLSEEELLWEDRLAIDTAIKNEIAQLG